MRRLCTCLRGCQKFVQTVTENRLVRKAFFFRKGRHEHVRPLLKALHWLPVKERIILKTAAFAFLFFDGTLPPFLSPSCLSVHTPPRTLRFSPKGLSGARWNLKGFAQTDRSLFRFVHSKLELHRVFLQGDLPCPLLCQPNM